MLSATLVRQHQQSPLTFYTRRVFADSVPYHTGIIIHTGRVYLWDACYQMV
jgi:hypothetical protein